MITSKKAKTTYDILDVIANRWSPVTFADTEVQKDTMMTLLEAASWAPSSYNEQPWKYVIGYKGDEVYEKLSDCLDKGNAWAKKAPVLMLSIAKKSFTYNGKENRHFMHDVGAASGYLVLQATALDLVTHQMAGFDLEKTRTYFHIDQEYEPVAMIAVGYEGNGQDVTEALRKRDESVRKRKTIEELIWK